MKQIALILFVFIGQTLFWAQNNVEILSAEISFDFVSKDVQGTFSGFSSSSYINFEEITASQFKGSVLVETIKTGNFLRDWSLKGGKYFSADDYQNISFESTSVSETDKGFVVKGLLTIKGISKPITIDFRKDGNQLIGTTSLYSSDYGINIKKNRGDNKVLVKMICKLK